MTRRGTGESEWLYADGRVKALENRLLTKQQLMRVLESSSFQEALQLLEVTVYQPWIANGPKPESISCMMDSALDVRDVLIGEMATEDVAVFCAMDRGALWLGVSEATRLESQSNLATSTGSALAMDLSKLEMDHSVTRDGSATLDGLILKRLDRSRFTAFGMDPIICFSRRTGLEVKALRIILNGKAAGLSVEEIRKKVDWI